MSARFEALFLPGADGGQRFALYHPPARAEALGAVLYLHPFAEEMNKVRRMAALQSRALAEAGYAVLQIDLLGCGDSSGELANARWQDWIDDALAGARWLGDRHSGTPLWLWGARAGSLLATAAAAALVPAPGLLLWAPTLNGQAQLQQFLRIKVAGEMMDGDVKGGLTSLKQTLDTGGLVEVAGYRLPGALASGMSGARLTPPARASSIAWLELSNREDATLSPASTQWLDQCRAAGHSVQARVVAGPAFWQTTEIEEAPALLQATADILAAMAS